MKRMLDVECLVVEFLDPVFFLIYIVYANDLLKFNFPNTLFLILTTQLSFEYLSNIIYWLKNNLDRNTWGIYIYIYSPCSAFWTSLVEVAKLVTYFSSQSSIILMSTYKYVLGYYFQLHIGKTLSNHSVVSPSL